MSIEDFDETVSAIEVTHSPATVSGVMTVVAAIVAMLSSGLVSVLALLFGFLGLSGVVAAMFIFESRRALLIGTGILFFSVLISGVQGNSPPLLVLSAIATILTFDLGQNAFSIGDQMSDDTRTQRGELVHAAASLLVGSIAAVVTYAVYFAAGGSPPVSSIVFVLLGAVLFVWAIRT